MPSDNVVIKAVFAKESGLKNLTLDEQATSHNNLEAFELRGVAPNDVAKYSNSTNS